MNVKPVFTPLLLALAAGLTACAATPTHESTGQAINDTATTAKVKAALIANPQTKARAISVKTYRGVVQLSGFVDSTDERTEAARVASHQPGVRHVEDELQIIPHGAVAMTASDSDLTAQVRVALSADPNTQSHQISVTASHGVVELSGFVDTNEQRAAAAQVARSVPEVLQVVDGLTLKPAQQLE